jgi:hypothetical protein
LTSASRTVQGWRRWSCEGPRRSVRVQVRGEAAAGIAMDGMGMQLCMHFGRTAALLEPGVGPGACRRAMTGQEEGSAAAGAITSGTNAGRQGSGGRAGHASGAYNVSRRRLEMGFQLLGCCRLPPRTETAPATAAHRPVQLDVPASHGAPATGCSWGACFWRARETRRRCWGALIWRRACIHMPMPVEMCPSSRVTDCLGAVACCR